MKKSRWLHNFRMRRLHRMLSRDDNFDQLMSLIELAPRTLADIRQCSLLAAIKEQRQIAMFLLPYMEWRKTHG